MSATYHVTGYVDVRIPIIEHEYHCSQSTTPEEIAKGVIFQLSCRIGQVEEIGHQLRLERIS